MLLWDGEEVEQFSDTKLKMRNILWLTSIEPSLDPAIRKYFSVEEIGLRHWAVCVNSKAFIDDGYTIYKMDLLRYYYSHGLLPDYFRNYKCERSYGLAESRWIYDLRSGSLFLKKKNGEEWDLTQQITLPDNISLTYSFVHQESIVFKSSRRSANSVEYYSLERLKLQNPTEC